MVGALESQFLKMLCSLKGAKAVLDVGTFTGMSALAFAEALPRDGKVVTLECDAATAEVARAAFARSASAAKLDLRVGAASTLMQQLRTQGATFDIIFLDADKENYVEYYELALDGLLAQDGVILADNSLCALLYDDNDVRSQKLHEFNQHVKNDSRTEQVVLTIREGITMIKRI
jgi:caffeoyl-CoA O-methyltransferase